MSKAGIEFGDLRMLCKKTSLWIVFLVIGGCDGPLAWPGRLSPPAPDTQPATAPAVREPASRPVADATGEPAILEPSQARPVILRPGDRFYFVMRLGEGFSGDAYVSMVHTRASEVYFAFLSAGQLRVQPQRHASMVLQVPAEAPEGLYDLRVRDGGRMLTARSSVRVVKEFKSRFRFVHLSDMNIGDPTAPHFDMRLPEEINLLAPEFIVATGDYRIATGVSGAGSPWAGVLDYFARFDAPVYMLCGERDDDAEFARVTGASPVGAFDYGQYHGILLLHHALRPLDAGQIDFVRRDLAEHRDAAFCFVAMNDDDPGVIRRLAGKESPAAFLQTHRVRMLLCGGDCDWDGREYAPVLASLPGLHYVRTHPASTTRIGRASGFSHYRVIEVNGEEASYAYPADRPDGLTQHSISAGALGVEMVGAEGDPPVTATAIIRNGLNQPFANCRVWVRLAKRGDARPRAAGGRLVQVLDGRAYWLCEVAVDVPDRGGVRAMVSVARDVPPLPVAVEFEVDEELRFASNTAPDGLTYHTSDGKAIVRVRNIVERPVSLRPTVRLLGQTLTVTTPERFHWPLTLEPGTQVDLPMKLLLPGLVEGRHYLQVSLQDDPLQRLHLQPVLVRRAVPATQ